MPGYDDLFDPGMQRVALKASTLKRPNQWPSNVSSMRKYTSYEGQTAAAVDPHPDSWHSDYMVRRASPHNPSPVRPYGTSGWRANAARMQAIYAHNKRLNAAKRAHMAHMARMGAARAHGQGAPAAPHVTDGRRWAWNDGKA